MARRADSKRTETDELARRANSKRTEINRRVDPKGNSNRTETLSYSHSSTQHDKFTNCCEPSGSVFNRCCHWTFDWADKARTHIKGGKRKPHTPEQDHHCRLMFKHLSISFIIECLNAGLGETISTPLTLAALAHWTLSYFPADPTASFAHHLPACYLNIAPVQIRHADCHNLCSLSVWSSRRVPVPTSRVRRRADLRTTQ